MVRQIVTSQINCGIKFKICDIIFLYSKKGWVIMTGTILSKVEPTYDKEQDSTTLNWGSNQQA